MDLLITSSLLVAFFAGMAALFAPCCITVLLPTYLASIFRQKRKVFFMTFIFFLGILIVFLPLGLGFGGLGQLINRLHDLIFFLGALFLIFLGSFILLGKHFSLLPFSVSPTLKNQNVFSVFVLGIFSGLATVCCAPVLAGVLALSVLPGSIFWGGMYALTYVLGMVVPLFLIALFLDRINLTEKFWVFRKTISYELLGKSVVLPLASLISGSMFLFVGTLIVILDLTGNLRMNNSFQLTINIYTAKITNAVAGTLAQIPGVLIATFFILMFIVIVKLALNQISKQK